MVAVVAAAAVDAEALCGSAREPLRSPWTAGPVVLTAVGNVPALPLHSTPKVGPLPPP